MPKAPPLPLLSPFHFLRFLYLPEFSVIISFLFNVRLYFAQDYLEE